MCFLGSGKMNWRNGFTSNRTILRLLLFVAVGTFQKEVFCDVVLSSVSLHQGRTLYCDCEFQIVSNGAGRLSRDRCGMKNVKVKTSTLNQVQIEHVVPVSLLAKDLFCWRSGGRNACQGDEDYEAMAGDLHNFMPAVDFINKKRSNFNFGIVNGEIRDFGVCDFEIDSSSHLAEPKESIRGDIARIYFYMIDRYKITVDKQYFDQLNEWSLQDPVDVPEIERDRRIKAIQGNSNPFVVADSGLKRTAILTK